MLNNEERRLYEMRAKMLKDETSALNKAKREGREEGIKEGKRDVARALLDVLDDETIALKTGLTEDEVRGLRKKA